jgi:HSP20 family protein
MSLTKTTPSSEVERPRRLFPGRLFDWPELFNWADVDTLRIEEFQEDGQMVVRAEAPGIDPDQDVELTVSDHRLRLHVARKQEEKSETTTGYRSEFHYGSFTRVVDLPAGATADDVKATYHDGILEVRVPIDRAKADVAKIPISRG